MPMTMCPECDSDFVAVGELAAEQWVTCPQCGAISQVVWLDPLELDRVDPPPNAEGGTGLDETTT